MQHELAVVVYAEQDGAWHPEQVFTRKWIRFADDSEGWTYDLFDGDWCRRDQVLHLYNSGGGPPYVGRGAEPGIHWRIWLAEGEGVSDGGVTHERPPGAPFAWRRPALTPAELHERGFEIITEHPSDIFADSSDERVCYCAACDDYLPWDEFESAGDDDICTAHSTKDRS